MAYTYARRKSSRRHWPKLLAGAVVFFPLSLARIDFRANFGRGLAISTYHGSPAYAALEDLSAEFDAVPDLAAADLPELELVRGRVTSPTGEVRQLALSGTTISQPVVIPPPPETVIALEPTDVYADPENSGSIRAVAHHLVRQELAKSNPERMLASTMGTKIIVRGQASAHPPRAALTPAESFRPKFTNLASVSGSPHLARALWLDGQVEMTGGLGFSGPEVELVIKRILDGRTLEKGRIWVTEGRFEIQVSKPTGQLVAELQTRDGRVFGRGEINLLGVASAVPRDLNRIGDLRIALRPTSEWAAVRAISAYSHGEHKIALNQAHVQVQSASHALTVDDEGLAVEPTLGPGSSYVVRTEAPGHRPTLALGDADRVRDVRLLSVAMVKALVELERKPADRARANLDGVVWGQVKENGIARAGATVELTGEQTVVYFNDLYLPDRNLTRTRANGLFAFLNVPSGVQAARVRVGERSFPAQIFAAEDQHVSVLDFDLNESAVAQFKVTDVLNERQPRAAELRLVGTDARVRVTGDDAVTFATSGGPAMVEADAGPEFEISRGIVTRDGGDVKLPVVRRAWLKGLHEFVHQPIDAGRGAVIGFVDEQDFEVAMTGAVSDEKLSVVYFDRGGRPRDPQTGVAGGGFAVLNAPPGVQTVTVRPTQSLETYSQIVVAEPNLVNVVSWAPAH